LDGDRLYTMTDRLTALSVSTLETLWSRPVEPGPLRQPASIALGYPELSAGEGAVTLCENSTLRAFDRLSGEQLWSYGMEPSGCGTFALLPGPRLYVPLTARSPEDERADDSIVEFAPSHLPAETAIIRGTVPSFESPPFGLVSPAGSKVTVDNTVVEVSETGSYEAKVTSRGVVRVDVHVPLPDDEDNEKCNPGAQGHAEVPLTGAGQYVVDLELERDCW
jgi:hypothetical protein